LERVPACVFGASALTLDTPYEYWLAKFRFVDGDLGGWGTDRVGSPVAGAIDLDFFLELALDVAPMG